MVEPSLTTFGNQRDIILLEVQSVVANSNNLPGVNISVCCMPTYILNINLGQKYKKGITEVSSKTFFSDSLKISSLQSY